jgi:oligopeptide/dipeptide ABC transporter ATP-binding protein
MTLLSVKGLKTCFHLEEGTAVAVDGVDLEIGRGETVALVGESGCGKSALALSVLKLIPDPPGKIEAGEILFKGRDLLRMPERELRAIRGNRIAMVFQEPTAALNPVMKVGRQIAEVFGLHQGMSPRSARDRAVEMLERVGIPAARTRAGEYPHQLSGGMQQRVMVAMALACEPDLLIADEPTTAVDVTVQAQLLDLFKKRSDMSILLITHDLSVVAEAADRMHVMYAAGIVERGEAREILEAPRHPYTVGLLDSLPSAGVEKLREIPGQVPDAVAFPSGCRFHPRCSRRTARCEREVPVLRELDPGRWAACHFPC